MDKKWHKVSDKLPEQGKKVLCMDRGDFFVLQRFKEFWFSIPFNDSKWSRLHPPEMWQEIEFPGELTGKIFMYDQEEEELLDMDNLEKKNPEKFHKLVDDMVDHFKNCSKKKDDSEEPPSIHKHPR